MGAWVLINDRWYELHGLGDVRQELTGDFDFRLRHGSVALVVLQRHYTNPRPISIKARCRPVCDAEVFLKKYLGRKFSCRNITGK